MMRKTRASSDPKKPTIPVSTRLREDQVDWIHERTIPAGKSDSEFLRELVDLHMAMERLRSA